MFRNFAQMCIRDRLIIELRGEKVLIDRDVAKLYGVETRDINKAVKNNCKLKQ